MKRKFKQFHHYKQTEQSSLTLNHRRQQKVEQRHMLLKTISSFGFHLLWLGSYLMKVISIPEKHRAH